MKHYFKQSFLFTFNYFYAECSRKTSFDSTSSVSSDDYSMDENLSTIGEEDEAAAIFELNGGNRDDHNQDLISKIINTKAPTRITLKLHVTANTYSIWETVLNNGNNNNKILYVAMPDKIYHEASKHSFISLLEFAEEKLECNAVILCLRKDRPDRAALVRTFLFLGFQPLSPTSPLAPSNAAAAIHSNVKTPDETQINDEDDQHLYLICHLED